MANQSYIRPQTQVFVSTAITDGNYNFNTSAADLPINVVDYFNFVDASGNLVDATSGSVTITADSGNGVFQGMNDSTFDAANADDPSRTKPSGRGRIEVLRVNLSGVVATNATGFQIALTQSLS